MEYTYREKIANNGRFGKLAGWYDNWQKDTVKISQCEVLGGKEQIASIATIPLYKWKWKKIWQVAGKL